MTREAAAVTEAAELPKLLRRPTLGWVLLVCGIAGLLASFMLNLEYLHLLTDRDAALICDINPFVTCGPAMLSSAAAIFGFPNVVVGLVSFTVVITTGVVLLTGVQLPRWYFIALQLGLIGAAVMITYLQIFSVFELGKLCLWCMIIWAFTIPLVALVTISNLGYGVVGEAAVPLGERLGQWAWVVVALWYLIVIAMIGVGMGQEFILAFRY
ncbi:vitamin K epoxide reductase family protein [uncultured Gulosibacter sp.]|uniref:vitamin K epoxide reductase family protein n=1 Tax=uncultured Gulosibacter sp. TaxID=1339167 RepID=UPI00288BA1B8|nr:vitamin K epoxide reductase family protein [uncultured Gulosibacter sp.]